MKFENVKPCFVEKNKHKAGDVTQTILFFKKNCTHKNIEKLES